MSIILSVTRKRFRVELILLVILAVFSTWIMFYVFYIKDGVMYSGYTVYGDYAAAYCDDEIIFAGK